MCFAIIANEFGEVGIDEKVFQAFEKQAASLHAFSWNGSSLLNPLLLGCGVHTPIFAVSWLSEIISSVTDPGGTSPVHLGVETYVFQSGKAFRGYSHPAQPRPRIPKDRGS